MRHLLFAPFLVAACLGLAGRARAQQLNFRTYTNVDGLPQVQALAVFQDSRGYMWFGTYAGIARYDGRHFKSFTSADGLVGNVVQAIAEEPTGSLLIGTLEGLSRYDGTSFAEVRMVTGEPILQVRAIHAEDRGVVWVATGRGLVRVEPGRTRRYGVGDGLPSEGVSTVYRTSRGDLLAGSEAGLVAYRDGRFRPVAEALGNVAVRAVVESAGIVWAATDAGLFRAPVDALEQFGRTRTPLPSAEPIIAAGVAPDGLMWFGSRHGALRWDGERFEALTRRAGLANDSIRALWVDREANVWFGTDTGVSKLVPGPFSNYSTVDGLPNDFVRDIAEDASGRIWLATRGGLAVIANSGRVRGLGPDQGLTETYGYAVAALADGSVLFGTLTGLVRWADGEETLYTHADGLPSDTVTALLIRASGDVAIGTRSGVVMWRAPERPSRPGAATSRPRASAFEEVPALAGRSIVDMEEDSGGRLWISTLDGALYRLAGTAVERLDRTLGFGDVTVWSLARDRHDGMWAGTNGRGAFHVRGDRVGRLSSRDGLVNDFVWQLLVDSRGSTWLYTNRGLDRWDGARFHHYDAGDGLRDLEGSLDAGLEDSRGRLWFGNGSGVLRFDPGRTRTEPTTPPVVINAVTVDGESLPLAERVAIPPGANGLSLSFAGLTFRDERDTAFRYRLLGLSDQWSPPTRDASISYARVPPGDYTFEVAARDADGAWSRQPARIRLDVAPTWLQTLWVRLLTIPALLLFVAGVYGVRHRRLNREKQRLAALVAEQTKDLARSEQRFRTALENSSTSVFHQDTELRYTWAYSRWDFLEAAAIIARTDEEIWGPPAAAALVELKRRALAGGEGVRERITVPARGAVRYFHVALEPTRDAAGVITGLTAAMIDETERHELESRLHQSQRMEAVGQLAGGVAHDFNNLLTGIAGYTELVLGEMPEGSAAASDLRTVRGFCDRAASLTQQLLAFSRRQPLDPVVLYVPELVDDATKMLRRLIREDIELSVRERESTAVRADRAQLEQVLMNLVVNARDAMPQGGRIEISTSVVPVGFDAARQLGVEPGRYAVLTVADEGTGMDAETRERIFEPFFTTKDVDKGTGLGLATVYGIVRQHGGGIDVESTPGKGTVFHIYLPAVTEEATTGAEPNPLPEQTTGAETILLVEDNDAVRELARRALEQRGYTLLVAEDPEAATRLFRTRAPEIDLLLTDVVMPGCSGIELWANLRRLGAECRVVFMSGYPDLKERISAQGYAGAPVLMKPFTTASLSQTVRLALDSPVPVEAPILPHSVAP